MGRSQASRSLQQQRSWWATQTPALQHFLCFIVLIVVAVYFSWPTLFSGRSLVGGDTVEWKAVAQSMLEYREETGEEPLWATNLFAGMPGYIVSSPALVPQIDELPRALRRITWPFSHVIVLLMGGYLLAWYLTRDTLSSLLAACAYAMTTYLPVILVAGHNTKFVALAFAPWLLLAFIHGMKKPNIVASLLFTIALAVNLRAGHVQITYYVTFLAFIWWVVLLFDARHRKSLPNFFKSTGLLAFGSGLALLMVAEYYWPTLEYKEFSIRGASSLGEGDGLSWDYAMRWSQNPKELLTLLFADAFGGATYYWGQKPFTGGPHYVGSIVLFLASIALLRIRSRLVAVLGIAGGLMVLFSFGRHFEGLNRIMFNYLPLFDAFRAPETWLITVALILAVLAALGLGYIVRRETSPEAEREKYRNIFIVLGITAGMLLFLMAAGDLVFDFQREGELQQVTAYVAQSSGRNPSDPQVVSAARQLLSEQVIPPRKDAFMDDAKRSFFFILLAGIAFIATQRKILPAWVLKIVLALLVVIDLGGVANRYLNIERLSISRDPANRIETLDVDEYVLRREGQFRVLSLERRDQTGLARPSFHHESLGGYSAAKLRIYQDFLDYLLFNPTTGMPNESMLDMMNVRYIFSQAPITGALDVEYGEESGLTVYENLDVLPRAYFVGETEVIPDSDDILLRLQDADFDPSDLALISAPIETPITPLDSSSTVSVTPISYGPRRFAYEVMTDAPRLLVVSELFYPAGWGATLDGENIPIHRANYLLRAVAIPAGNHTLEMTFNPSSYIWGKRISLISTIFVYGLALCLIGLSGIGYFRRRRR